MLREAIFFSINLGSFVCLVWSIFSLQNNKLTSKLKKLPFFISFAFIFYGFFYFSNVLNVNIFEIKNFYFNGYTILIQIVLVISLMALSKQSIEHYAPILSILFSPYIFFTLFGLENFNFWENNYSSYSLLKTQNPIIGLVAFILYLIKPNKVQIGLSLLVIIILFYQINPLKEFPYPEIKTVYHKHIPYEYFLSENSYLFEENSGIYTEKKQNADDVLFKFTMRPIRKIKLPLRQEIQSLISTFEFPIIVSEENTITILELSRSFNGKVFQVIFHLVKDPIHDSKNINIATMQIEGPLF